MSAESKAESFHLPQIVSPKEYLEQLNTALREKSYQVGRIVSHAGSSELKMAMNITVPDRRRNWNFYFIRKPEGKAFLVSVQGNLYNPYESSQWKENGFFDGYPDTQFHIDFKLIPKNFAEHSKLSDLPKIHEESNNPYFSFDFNVKMRSAYQGIIPIYKGESKIEFRGLKSNIVKDFLPNQEGNPQKPQ